MAAPLQTLVAHPDEMDEAGRSGMPDPSAVPDADMVAVAWTDSLRRGPASRPDKAKSLSVAMLVLGAVLLLFVPVSAVFFLIAGGLGLTMTSGVHHPGAKAAPAVSTTATGLSPRR
jgi:hypothetical protein